MKDEMKTFIEKLNEELEAPVFEDNVTKEDAFGDTSRDERLAFYHNMLSEDENEQI